MKDPDALEFGEHHPRNESSPSPRMIHSSNPNLKSPETTRAHLVPFPLLVSLIKSFWSFTAPVEFRIPSSPFCRCCIFLVMAMATGATMATYTAVRSPSQLHHNNNKATGSAIACPALSSRTSIAFSGLNAVSLKANRIASSSNVRRLSVNAVMEVDIAKIKPQADRVLIRLETLASQSAGGVLLPSAAVKFDRYLQGEIIAAGSEVTEVEKGQKVMFADINAYEVNLGTSDRLCFCRSGDLLAIVQ